MDTQRLELDGERKLEVTQFIVTKIGNEQYGIDIKYVDNIVRMQKITRVPKAQPYFKGVINLRGVVIPVMSLRLRFELPEIDDTNNTRIIIIKPDKVSPMGIIVDSVREVLDINENDMAKPDTSDARMQYIASIAKHGDELISILNIQNLVQDKE